PVRARRRRMTTEATCPRCNDAYTQSQNANEAAAFSELVCEDCRPMFPLSLLKATIDPFFYALRMSTGEVIHFVQATIHGDYVRIGGDTDGENQPLDNDEVNSKLPHRFYRGLDVRVQDIVWCADAPDGS